MMHCERCGQFLAAHAFENQSICCKCYVMAGNAPIADHVNCQKAALIQRLPGTASPTPIGSGVLIQYLTDGALTLIGIVVNHVKPDGTHCEGTVLWQQPDAAWTLLSLEPLTLTPSIHCHCGTLAGMIQSGRWLPIPGEHVAAV